MSVPETEFVSGVEVSRVLLEECDADTVNLLLDVSWLWPGHEPVATSAKLRLILHNSCFVNNCKSVCLCEYSLILDSFYNIVLSDKKKDILV